MTFALPFLESLVVTPPVQGGDSQHSERNQAVLDLFLTELP